ncbi:MAG: hypothetical protein LBM05_00595 [Endomicrobium sp.]|nr:hypothetical protein [Endomicrobium sp.]
METKTKKKVEVKGSKVKTVEQPKIKRVVEQEEGAIEVSSDVFKQVIIERDELKAACEKYEMILKDLQGKVMAMGIDASYKRCDLLLRCIEFKDSFSNGHITRCVNEIETAFFAKETETMNDVKESFKEAIDKDIKRNSAGNSKGKK